MKLSKTLILPLASVLIVGACAPYEPLFSGRSLPSSDVKLAAEEQAKKAESEAAAATALKRQQAADLLATKPKPVIKKPTYKPPVPSVIAPKPNYPTAASIPSRPGFVFNPYTQNLVNVKGIASGKLVRDPEDSNKEHMFRVP